MALISPSVRKNPEIKLANKLFLFFVLLYLIFVEFFTLNNENPNHKKYNPPKILITINKLPIVSATIDKPHKAKITRIKSPKTIPADTARPLIIPNVAERVTTRNTLALGIAASTIMIPNSAINSIIFIFYPIIN